MSRNEIDDLQRGSRDPAFDDLARAARDAAAIESRALFHGWPEARIEGVVASSPYAPCISAT